jgi:hypothetical protein
MIIKKLMAANNRGGVVTLNIKLPVHCLAPLQEDDSAVALERLTGQTAFRDANNVSVADVSSPIEWRH